MPHLVQLQIGNASIELNPTCPRVLIGRDARSCDLAIEDMSISRRHAEVFLDGGRTFIRDLGSSNGTWVEGNPVSAMPVELQPGMSVYVGHTPLLVEWQAGGQIRRTAMGEASHALRERMGEHQQMVQQRIAAPSAQAFPSAAPLGPAPTAAHRQPSHFAVPAQAFAQAAPVGPAPTAAQAGTATPVASELGESRLGVGGVAAPLPSTYTYRRQGTSKSGVLLIALKGDTFTNSTTIEGYVEYTALADATVASIVVELWECHQRGPKKGHVWDRVLVRQGPWRARKGDVIPLPFELRIPAGTSISGRDVYWELRGYVDIDWAFDIDATCPINMRNIHIERIRDALGALDYRIVSLEPEPLGQRYKGKFVPPPRVQSELGIATVKVDVEYLGANMKVLLEVEKTSLFKLDRKTEFTFELEQLKTAPLEQLSAFLEQQINGMLVR